MSQKPPLLSARQLELVTGAHCDLELAAGEIHCISGASGSGKTLLLRALADLDETPGEVRLLGQARESYRPEDWRRQVMLSPAQPRWWFGSVAEHLDGDIGDWPSALRLDAARLDAPLGQLSTGEQSRCGLLRALSHGPTVLLLDEPTGALDPKGVRAVESLLRNWLEGEGPKGHGDTPGEQDRLERAIVWITHDEDQIERVATWHWRMEHGEGLIAA